MLIYTDIEDGMKSAIDTSLIVSMHQRVDNEFDYTLIVLDSDTVYAKESVEQLVEQFNSITR